MGIVASVDIELAGFGHHWTHRHAVGSFRHCLIFFTCILLGAEGENEMEAAPGSTCVAGASGPSVALVGCNWYSASVSIKVSAIERDTSQFKSK